MIIIYCIIIVFSFRSIRLRICTMRKCLQFYNLCLNIFGNIYKDRTRSALKCNSKSFWNNGKKIMYISYKKIMFCNRNSESISINFLESICTDCRKRNLSCNCNKRYRIKFCISNGC